MKSVSGLVLAIIIIISYFHDVFIGACVEVFSDEDNNFKGLYFQDKQMIEAFQAYPELLCVDATYKLLNLGIPVYLLMCEDSNGQSEIVGVCLLVSEDIVSMQWMLSSFKKHNLKWSNTKVIMADKDIKERDVFKESFPDAAVLICLFHTLRTFRREITSEKMGITMGQRILCLDSIQKMAYASNLDEYTNLYDMFKNSCPKTVVDYFNDNWHPIKEEWVMGFKAACGSFLNFTNNRLESINGKLKQVISCRSTLEEFIMKFFVILTSLRTERDHKAALMFQKVKVRPFSKDTPEAKYCEVLTSYASDFVIKQLSLMEKVKQIQEKDGVYTVETNSGLKTVSTKDCNCVFRQSMKLPCRHMLVLRKNLKEPLFDAECCDERWTSHYYRQTQRLFSSLPSAPSVTVSLHNSKSERKLSQQEKFRKANILTTELAAVVSEASRHHFYRRLELLKELIDGWKNGDEMALSMVDEGIADYTPPPPNT